MRIMLGLLKNVGRADTTSDGTNLLPNPRIGTPWRYLYESNDYRAFLSTMGEIGDTDGRANLMETCFRLHNLKTRQVGINHIRNVYVPAEDDGEGRVWEGFEEILFPAPHGPDRVSSFHVQEEWY